MTKSTCFFDKWLLKASAHQITGELNCANLPNTGYISHCWREAVRFLQLSADGLQNLHDLRALSKKEKPVWAVEL